MKFKSIFANWDFRESLKFRFIKCYIWSVLLYGMESFTLKMTIIRVWDVGVAQRAEYPITPGNQWKCPTKNKPGA